MLGLELKPHGGAALEALARRGDAGRFALPVPMRKHANCDFSFAGLKTGVRLCIERELPAEGDPGEAAACGKVAAAGPREQLDRPEAACAAPAESPAAPPDGLAAASFNPSAPFAAPTPRPAAGGR